RSARTLCVICRFPGVNEELLDTVLFPSERQETKHWYNILLVEKLIKIISYSCQSNSRIRLVTLELSIRLLTQLVMKNSQSFLHDCHLAAIEGAKEESTALLRNFYKVRNKTYTLPILLEGQGRGGPGDKRRLRDRTLHFTLPVCELCDAPSSVYHILVEGH
ncbi:unnamed protein product, partial [Timema podura]|nr:unnamed protein product [Timema podura]